MRNKSLTLLAGLVVLASGTNASNSLKYGSIVYRHNLSAPYQLYFIAQLHRHPVSRSVINPKSPRVQVEVCRIVDELVRTVGVDLILDEGRAASEDYDKYNAIKESNAAKFVTAISQVYKNDKELEALFGGEEDIEAPQVLQILYRVNVQGAEDSTLLKTHLSYANQCLDPKTLQKRLAILGSVAAYQAELSRVMDSLGEWRTSAVLKNLSPVLRRESSKGRRTRNVALILGYGHFDELERSWRSGEISVPSVPEFGLLAETDPYTDRKDFGVTIIVPRSIK